MGGKNSYRVWCCITLYAVQWAKMSVLSLGSLTIINGDDDYDDVC